MWQLRFDEERNMQNTGGEKATWSLEFHVITTDTFFVKCNRPLLLWMASLNLISWFTDHEDGVMSRWSEGYFFEYIQWLELYHWGDNALLCQRSTHSSNVLMIHNWKYYFPFYKHWLLQLPNNCTPGMRLFIRHVCWVRLKFVQKQDEAVREHHHLLLLYAMFSQ